MTLLPHWVSRAAALALLLTGFSLRAQNAGSLDTAFSADASASGLVQALAVQTDGSVIIAGSFTSLQGTPRANMARIKSDGTLDTTFDPSPNGKVNDVVVQPDGKILLAGEFTDLQPNGAASPTTRNHVARVNADGSLDTRFDPNTDDAITSLALQPDGKVIFGGSFITVRPNGIPASTYRPHIARVNADGTLDTFNPQTNNLVNTIVVQTDGAILLGGNFTGLQPNGTGSVIARHNLARVFDDGTVDMGFAPEPDNAIRTIAVQSDGGIIFAGTFDALQKTTPGSGIVRANIARCAGDGTIDLNFAPQIGSSVQSVVLQANGQILVGGLFSEIREVGANFPTTRNRIARLNADGTIDASFDPNASGGFVNGIAVRADGEIYVAGSFTALQPNGAGSPTARNGLALLTNDAATQSLTVPDFTQVQWQRSGAAPEAIAVTFEYSPDGATWFPLGPGARVTGGWQITGINLNGIFGAVRARARITSGAFSSSGVTQQITAFDFDNAPGFTVTPAFTAPAANSATKSPVTVSYTLPETAASHTVTVSFGTAAQTLVLSPTLETAGAHTFTFDPADPVNTSNGAVQSIASGSIPDGAYGVTLSYQDARGHLPAIAANTNVRLDTVTMQPGLMSPVTDGLINGTFPSANDVITFTLPETALPDSVQIVFDDGVTQYPLTLTATEATSGVHSFYFDPTDPVTLNYDALVSGHPAAVAIGPASIPDGTYSVYVRYQDALANTAATSNVVTGVIVDTVTEKPTLTSPPDNTEFSHTILVSYHLPEAASNLFLQFDNIGFYLSAAMSTAGDHSFTFDPADPVGTSGGAIAGDASGVTSLADGKYSTVYIDYNDLAMNNGAFATHANVIIDTTPPTIGPPNGGFSPLVAVAGTALGNYTGKPITSDANGVAVSQDPPIGTMLTAGTTHVVLTATDPAGNQATTDFYLEVRPAFPVNTVALSAGPNGDAPTGTGATGGPPADAKLTSFGTPAIDGAGNLAYLAQWTSPTAGKGKGLFTSTRCLAKIGDAVPNLANAKFKTFTDPVIDAGEVACLATFTSVPKASASAVVSFASDGTFSIVAQSGQMATSDNATFKTFKEVAVLDGYIGFLAQLNSGTGTTPKTTGANATGLWIKDGSDPLQLMLRQGQSIAGSTIKTLVSFAGGNGSPGQGRGWLRKQRPPGAQMMGLCLLANKQQAIVSVDAADPQNPSILSQTDLGNSVGSPDFPDGEFASYNLPSANQEGDRAFLGKLETAFGGIPLYAAHGIFFASASQSAFDPLVQIKNHFGPNATEYYNALSDPVLAADGGLAFPTVIKIDKMNGAAAALWWQPPGGSLTPLAQAGTSAVETDGGIWKSFNSLAIAAGRGPIFSATLAASKAAPKGTTNGVWAEDFQHNLRLLFRTGLPGAITTGKTLKSFTLLNATVGSTGVTRSFNDNAQVTWLATFTDKSQAIVTTEVP